MYVFRLTCVLVGIYCGVSSCVDFFFGIVRFVVGESGMLEISKWCFVSEWCGGCGVVVCVKALNFWDCWFGVVCCDRVVWLVLFTWWCGAGCAVVSRDRSWLGCARCLTHLMGGHFQLRGGP